MTVSHQWWTKDEADEVVLVSAIFLQHMRERNVPAYSSKFMPSHILHKLQQCGFVIRVWALDWPVYCPDVTSLKMCGALRSAKCEMKTPDCWTTEAVYQAWIGKNFTFNSFFSQTLYWVLWKEKQMKHSGKHGPFSKFFWIVLQASN